MRLLSTNSSCTFGWNQERLMSYGICHFLFGCCFFLVSLACVSPSWLSCMIRRVAPNPRIQRSEFVNSYLQQPVCCLVFFFLYSESISGLDALHTVHNSLYLHTLPMSKLHQYNRLFSRGHDPYTLACKARPSFDGCRTFLSVSVSLSLSLSLLFVGGSGVVWCGFWCVFCGL